jgi:hypothetical protein
MIPQPTDYPNQIAKFEDSRYTLDMAVSEFVLEYAEADDVQSEWMATP